MNKEQAIEMLQDAIEDFTIREKDAVLHLATSILEIKRIAS